MNTISDLIGRIVIKSCFKDENKESITIKLKQNKKEKLNFSFFSMLASLISFYLLFSLANNFGVLNVNAFVDFVLTTLLLILILFSVGFFILGLFFVIEFNVINVEETIEIIEKKDFYFNFNDIPNGKFTVKDFKNVHFSNPTMRIIFNNDIIKTIVEKDFLVEICNILMENKLDINYFNHVLQGIINEKEEDSITANNIITALLLLNNKKENKKSANMIESIIKN